MTTELSIHLGSDQCNDTRYLRNQWREWNNIIHLSCDIKILIKEIWLHLRQQLQYSCGTMNKAFKKKFRFEWESNLWRAWWTFKSNLTEAGSYVISHFYVLSHGKHHLVHNFSTCHLCLIEDNRRLEDTNAKTWIIQWSTLLSVSVLLITAERLTITALVVTTR